MSTNKNINDMIRSYMNACITHSEEKNREKFHREKPKREQSIELLRKKIK